jgi:hypothetical protein
VFLYGLWNPVALTIALRTVFPFQHVASRLKLLLDGQVLLFALSLYLLSTTTDRWDDLRTSVVLPRYFTFALLLFTLLNWERLKARPLPAIWKLPFARRSLCAQLGWLNGWPTLVRIAIWLNLSVLVTPTAIRWKETLRHATPAIAWIYCISILAVMAQLQGLPELLTSLANPQFHPIAAAFFTFLSGILLGVFTGHFGVAFFPLATTLVGTFDTPLIRAALLDGALLGCLLSPLSMLNQATIVLFHFAPADLFRARWNQMKVPFAVGILIYMVSAFNSVAILRPVTFVFLCLVAVAIRLRQVNWKFGPNMFDLPAKHLGNT